MKELKELIDLVKQNSDFFTESFVISVNSDRISFGKGEYYVECKTGNIFKKLENNIPDHIVEGKIYKMFKVKMITSLQSEIITSCSQLRKMADSIKDEEFEYKKMFKTGSNHTMKIIDNKNLHIDSEFHFSFDCSESEYDNLISGLIRLSTKLVEIRKLLKTQKIEEKSLDERKKKHQELKDEEPQETGKQNFAFSRERDLRKVVLIRNANSLLTENSAKGYSPTSS